MWAIDGLEHGIQQHNPFYYVSIRRLIEERHDCGARESVGGSLLFLFLIRMELGKKKKSNMGFAGGRFEFSRIIA